MEATNLVRKHVHMLPLHVGDESHGGGDSQEAVVVLVCLQALNTHTGGSGRQSGRVCGACSLEKKQKFRASKHGKGREGVATCLSRTDLKHKSRSVAHDCVAATR